MTEYLPILIFLVFAFLLSFGAFFFVFSDTLLSLQLFHTDFYRAHLFVMLTYLLAQVLLVYGLIYVETRKYIISH